MNGHFEKQIIKKGKAFSLCLDDTGRYLLFYNTIKGQERVVKSFEFRNDFKMVYPHSLFFSIQFGIYIHSDINGAFNIGRLLLPDLFNASTVSPKDMLISPLKVKILNRVKKRDKEEIMNRNLEKKKKKPSRC